MATAAAVQLDAAASGAARRARTAQAKTGLIDRLTCAWRRRTPQAPANGPTSPPPRAAPIASPQRARVEPAHAAGVPSGGSAHATLAVPPAARMESPRAPSLARAQAQSAHAVATEPAPSVASGSRPGSVPANAASQAAAATALATVTASSAAAASAAVAKAANRTDAEVASIVLATEQLAAPRLRRVKHAQPPVPGAFRAPARDGSQAWYRHDETTGRYEVLRP
jgi:hypothetical protein